MAAVTNTYVFKVEMSCEGCANAIKNVLTKVTDNTITKFDVDLKSATVEIESILPVEELTEILSKTGKKVTFLKQK